MPSYNGVSVNITDEHDAPLVEWGTRTHSRTNSSTCYVRSESKKAFRISIRPNLPFAAFGDESARIHNQWLEQERWDSIDDFFDQPGAFDRQVLRPGDIVSQRLFNHVKWLEDEVKGRDWSPLLFRCREGPYSKEALECLEYFARKYSLTGYTVSSKYSTRIGVHQQSAAVPYHLMATIRFEGRKGFEKQSVIYLDSNHKGFKSPDGVTTMAGCKTQDSDGIVVEHGWIFAEVGIETAFDTLLLSSSDEVDTGDVDMEDVDTTSRTDEGLVAAFDHLGAASMNDAEEKTKVGQIEVTFERVMVGKRNRKVNYQCEREIHSDDDEDVTYTSTDLSTVSHATARGARKIGGDKIEAVEYSQFVDGEAPFATFTFYARSEGILKKLGFEGASTTTTATARRKRDLGEATMVAASSVPLSALQSHEVEGLSVGGRLVEGLSVGVKKLKVDDEEDEDEVL